MNIWFLNVCLRDDAGRREQDAGLHVADRYLQVLK